MFCLELNGISVFKSMSALDIKKEIKKMVYIVRNNYMFVGKVYAQYYNSRLCVNIILHPYNILNGIDKILYTIETSEVKI